jgi:hypothetical protein
MTDKNQTNSSEPAKNQASSVPKPERTLPKVDRSKTIKYIREGA